MSTIFKGKIPLRGLTATLLFTFAACAVGPRVESFEPARGPAGVIASIHLQDGSAVKGELLAVEEASIVILNGGVVTRVPYAWIREGKFPQTGVKLTGGTVPLAAARERLRLVSRFPQGLGPDLLSSLLRAYGQQSIASVPR